MKTTTKVWLGASALLALIVALYCYKIKPAEPSYQGKSLSEWINKIGRGGVIGWNGRLTNKNIEIANALRAMGTNSFPMLVERLIPKELKIQIMGEKINRSQSLVRIPTGPDPWERQDQALSAFMLLGPDAKLAIPQIAALLNDPESAYASTTALIYIGDDAYPVILQALNHSNSMISVTVAKAIGFQYEHGAFAVPALISKLEHKDISVRREVIYALGLIKSKPEIAVPALIKMLSEPEPSVYRSAAEAVSKFRTNAIPALPALHQLLTQTDLQPERRERIEWGKRAKRVEWVLNKPGMGCDVTQRRVLNG